MDHFVSKSGFAMIDVCNYRNIPDILHAFEFEAAKVVKLTYKPSKKANIYKKIMANLLKKN